MASIFDDNFVDRSVLQKAQEEQLQALEHFMAKCVPFHSYRVATLSDEPVRYKDKYGEYCSIEGKNVKCSTYVSEPTGFLLIDDEEIETVSSLNHFSFIDLTLNPITRCWEITPRDKRFPIQIVGGAVGEDTLQMVKFSYGTHLRVIRWNFDKCTLTAPDGGSISFQQIQL